MDPTFRATSAAPAPQAAEMPSGETVVAEFAKEDKKPKQKPLSEIPDDPDPSRGLVIVEILYRLPRSKGPTESRPIWMKMEGAAELVESDGPASSVVIRLTDSRGTTYEGTVETTGRPWSGF